VCFVAGSHAVVARTTNAGLLWRVHRFANGTRFDSVSCPGVRRCYLVGNRFAPDFKTHDPVVLSTRTGGSTWSALHLHSGAGPLPLQGFWIISIACARVTSCVVLGSRPSGASAVLVTRNAGRTWRAKDLGLDSLVSLACPSPHACVSVGRGLTAPSRPVVWTTHDGGSTWHRQVTAFVTLDDVACPAVSVCYAAGARGGNLTGSHGPAVVASTFDGGRTWRPAYSIRPWNGTQIHLACPGTRVCYAVGQGGTVWATADGWRSAVERSIERPLPLVDVSCPATLVCYALGQSIGTLDSAEGSVSRTTDGGRHWHVL
jgi:photosystem II stability/assembly factor-like uncharacterized protein